ncbi:UDP-2,4-diacetamido-2,4,6-trideoxy-beta-L-altropyranose hydrolase [Brevibacillus sp. GCM10020057]|uniref:UDP-2,4-diacetamido-2,4, 6-trideoxy-beta-L-altropyranose hydrolase n=1 Tax=Brevibacillus sp. GCM10020057 TaxID=3317327 RepID=UPI00362A8F56
MPHVVFRTDSSTKIGSGHVMRCLTLANALRDKGWKATFICNLLPGNMADWISDQGFQVVKMPIEPDELGKVYESPYSYFQKHYWEKDVHKTLSVMNGWEESVEWLVVDHYGIDSKWERIVKPFVHKIMVIDDLENREHCCDLLLDQNLLPNMESRYQGKVSKATELLMGPKYALIRPEFVNLRKRITNLTVNPNQICIFFGGSDPSNQTRKTLDALDWADLADIKVEVVIGSSNPHREELQAYCEQAPNVQLHIQTPKMPEIIARSGYVIGAGGTNTWERCCLGKPTLLLTVAENQVEISKEVHRQGAALYLGCAERISAYELGKVIRELHNKPEILNKMAEIAFTLVDGRGVDRVINRLVTE